MTAMRGKADRTIRARAGGAVGMALVAVLVASLGTVMTALPAAAAVPAMPGMPGMVDNGPTSATDETKVPHYFGPYPNWANSPQVLANAMVMISGGGGMDAEAEATVNPKNGSISSITVTKPGTGYTSAPDVAVEAAGVQTTPAAATADISRGVLTRIEVAEAGFGFTAPAVTITGGNPTPGLEAGAIASGGVDDLTIIDGGSGYTIQPIVEFTLPDQPNGTIPTATADMDASGVVTSVTVVTEGSGYSTAPTVTLRDANLINATAASVTATIGIAAIELTSGGEGYDSAPVVTIADTVGTADKGASATAIVAAKGAVTGITVTSAGSGYLTPGLKKFVDTLPGMGPDQKNDLGQYIPTAVPDTTTYPGADYYEIAVVQYRMKFHRDLPATLLRGYVQLSTSVVPGNRVALTNANLDPTMADTPIDGFTGVDGPHYLGPTIVATKDKPVRILFRNLLPTGVDGDLFLPVDTSMMGSGAGPDMMQLDADGVPMDMAADEGSVLDGVRNPMCGATPKPSTCYSENRATLHLHGGITPWISDGTPHQWVTPSGEQTAYPKGVSVSNVPDMADPGPGAETFFYTNQQSARLMFYHDHAWGITRLNVYAGEAADYLITDATEQKLIAPDGPLAGMGLGLPLNIQDKTFVPDAATLAQVDPTWNSAKWGGTGSLWTPHVYMPAQNPGDPSGMSSFGRWMYGPWFWPPAKDAKYPPIANPYYDASCDADVQPFCEPAMIPATPNVSVGMEAFNDTPIVNGTAYPKTTVDPKSYRYRIINDANDRFWNLSWYVADPTTGTLSEVALKPAEVLAAQTDPVVTPTVNTALSPKGPDWIQIGSEGGFLPAPVVVPAHDTTWITDPTRFDVGNVDQHSLLLAPAERADVVVDFSQYRGKTLILYNDAPAAFPARVPGYDYYTGNPDLSPAGAPSTLAGYGPNTRTIMQVTVSTKAPEVAFDRPNTTADRMGALNAAFAHHLDAAGNPAGVFESGQNPVIVGQSAYNSAYGTNFASSGWCNAPKTPSAKCDGFARIQEQGGDEFKFDTLSGNQLSLPLQGKGLHDEMNSANFDEWGRMTANLGLEAPGATPLLQNIILYPYVNPATEILDSTGEPSSLDVTPISTSTDGTQIWKITHNGVDTHPIHFHLYDVQVINRVTWDNIIIPPEPTELGWKDTVRVSPLEDTLVAVRPIVPTLPFGVPDSMRPLNPMMPIGAMGSINGPNGTEAGFNNTDTNGNPVAPVKNVVANFGWEYVWHCHILSHEEMDMMRPVTVHAARSLADAPVLALGASGTLGWTDGTPVDYTQPTTWTNPGTAEIGYRVERAEVINDTVGAYATETSVLANLTSYAPVPPDPTMTYDYRVTAWNAAGDSQSNVIRVVGLPQAPTGFTATVESAPALPAGAQVALAWTNNATNATSVVLERSAGTDPFTVIATLAPTETSFVDSTVLPGSYAYRVQAVNPIGASAYAGPVTVDVAKPGSTTVVLNAPNPSLVGENVTFTATVSGVLASGTPTGAVDFTVNGTTTAVSLDAVGAASYATTSLPAGDSLVTASYGGDTVFMASSANTTQTVNKIATTAVLVSSANPSTFGSDVTFTTTVSPSAATGTVQFIVDGSPVGAPVALAAGGASYTVGSLAVGAHVVSASYGGDAAYLGSVAPGITQTIGGVLRPTTTTVTSNRVPSTFGQTVTFTATVRPVTGTGTPTGSVQFNIDGVNVVGVQTLNAQGRATYATAALSGGTHAVIATYRGSAIFAGGGSAPLNQDVNLGTSKTTLTRNRTTLVFGQSITFTARVTPLAAAGTVQFMFDGAAVGGPVTLDATGRATLVTSTLAVGSHTVSVTSSGNANYLPSASNTLTQTVRQGSSRAVVTSSGLTAARGATVVFTATVTAAAPATGVPAGSVQFRIDGVDAGGPVALNPSGQAAYATSALTAGRHTVIAVYSGSNDFAASTSRGIRQRIV
ncbi:Ig-like domain repeat protein [Cryobacterium sp. PH29-G1]|uniref:Ig-like domain repeat protein n=1 Tax=Cryobacterium sp. PH29-G1 TaxID=3046211 RepID=UPI0024B96F5D|nr:Ig-like domain repeat protein [Cryobacterium sp. PH29-G1]